MTHPPQGPEPPQASPPAGGQPGSLPPPPATRAWPGAAVPPAPRRAFDAAEYAQPAAPVSQPPAQPPTPSAQPGPSYQYQVPAQQPPTYQPPQAPPSYSPQRSYPQQPPASYAPQQPPSHPQQPPARAYPQPPSYGQQPPSYPQQPPAYPQQPPARAYPYEAAQGQAYAQGPAYPGAGYAQQQPAAPTYGPAYGGYPAAPPATPAWSGPTAWPPQQQAASYQHSAAYPGQVGTYGPYGYPPQAPAYPAPKKRHGGRVLLVLLSLAIVVGVAVPVVTAFTSGGYANSSYVPPQPNSNPPGLPKVTNESTAHDTVTGSALYAQTVPNPTRCTVTTIDLSAASESELQAHMSDVVACLMRVWDTTVSKAGFEMPRPPVIVYSSSISTACGKLATLNAAYCGSDQKIYYATDLPQAIPSGLRSSRFIVEVIVAHEFGHAVQARTGILSAAHSLEDAAATETASNEWSRRTELQADCFAGLFIRSVSKSAGIAQQDLDNIAALMIAFGDDSLSKNTGIDGGHGLGATRKYWMQLGLASTATNVCNTFTAGSDEVR